MRNRPVGVGRLFVAVLLFLASLPGAPLFGQAPAPAPAEPSAAKALWSFEVPFEISPVNGGGQNVRYRFLDCTGDGIRDLVVIALPKRGIYRLDYEAFCLDGTTGATVWHSELTGSKTTVWFTWIGHCLLMVDDRKFQHVLDLRSGAFRTDLPEMGNKRYPAALTAFEREWPWGDDAVVSDYALKGAEVLSALYMRLPAKPGSPAESFKLMPQCPGLFTSTKAFLNTAGALLCLDRSTGAVLWRAPYEKGGGCAFLGADATHLAIGWTSPKRLSLVALETGAEVWSAPLYGDFSDPRSFYAQPVLTSTHIACYQGKGQGVTVFSRQTGQVAWEERATDPYWLIPIGAEGFGLRETHHFRIFRVGSKEPVLDLPIKKVQSLQPEADRLYLVSRPADRILALDKTTLKILWEKEVELARGWGTIPTPILSDRLGNRLIGFFSSKVVLLDGKSGEPLGQISDDDWRSLWPLPGYDRFLEYRGGAELRCTTLGETFGAAFTRRQARKMDLVADATRVVVRDGRTFRMIASPCPLPDQPPPDDLTDYVAFFRELSEYTSTWMP